MYPYFMSPVFILGSFKHSVVSLTDCQFRLSARSGWRKARACWTYRIQKQSFDSSVLPLETGLRRNILITFERYTGLSCYRPQYIYTSYISGSPTTVKTRFISVRFGGTKQERKLGAGVIIHIFVLILPTRREKLQYVRKIYPCEVCKFCIF